MSFPSDPDGPPFPWADIAVVLGVVCIVLAAEALKAYYSFAGF